MANKKKNDSDSLEEQPTVITPTPDAQNTKEHVNTDESEGLVLNDSQNSASTSETPAHRPSGIRRLTNFANLYFIIFILLLVLMIGGIFVSIKLTGDDNDSKTPKTQSLTDKQLAELRGSTTLVGDSNQVLDIQGSAVFEEQVLMRKNLDVAGSIKVGGSLSLPAITVGGSSSFGQIQVNETLTVNGNTTLQGQLNIQRGLTVAGTASFNGALSVNQLNVSNLQLTGDLTLSRHIATSGGTPSRSNGSALGSGGTVSINGTDTAGTVTINTGGGPPAGCFTTINFTNRYNATPHVIISPSNSSSAGLQYYTNRTTTNMSICTANAPAGGTNYLFDYIIFD